MWNGNWLDGWLHLQIPPPLSMETQPFGMDTLASMIFPAIVLGTIEVYYRYLHRFFQGRNSHLANPMHSWADSKDSRMGANISPSGVDKCLMDSLDKWLYFRYLIHSEDGSLLAEY